MRGKALAAAVKYARYGITPAYAGKSIPMFCCAVRAQDHPRVCGEKKPYEDEKPPALGSPPRMRGKAIPISCWNAALGITPAYAGKRHPHDFPEAEHGDHPRVCGEKTASRHRRPRRRGSPPRMRGKDFADIQQIVLKGITPAYAGKRYTVIRILITSWDHPRVCGEKRAAATMPCEIRGSPPRMRGKVEKRSGSTINMGITPAYAGKRGKPVHINSGYRDHPRVCGEKSVGQHTEGGGRGSPPRMRGKVAAVDVVGHIDGITPAYAGKSWSRRAESRKKRDHPRVCGEKRLSSLMMWSYTWITPAYAGKSKGQQARTCPFWDHPRVCGEKKVACLQKFNQVGSPPRMRGKGNSCVVAVDGLGITPAYAGKRSPLSPTPSPVRDHPRVCGEKPHGVPSRSASLGSPPRMRGKD